MDKLKELIEQYEQGLMTDKEFWAKVAELACKEYDNAPA